MRFATDIADYAAYALARVLRSPDFEWTAERADDWRKPWPDFSGTRYEAKAKREGRVPAYFIFRKIIVIPGTREAREPGIRESASLRRMDAGLAGCARAPE